MLIWGGSNPVAELERNKENDLEKWRIFGGAFIEADIVEDLTFKTLFGVDYRNQYFPGFAPLITEAIANTNNGLYVSYNFHFDWTWYNTLNYSKTINDAHKINILAGTEALRQQYTELGASRSGFFSEDINYRYLDAGESGISNNGSGSKSTLFSLFAKVNYVFKEKYLFDATIRRDGSSRFSEMKRYATFPAFSAGWRMSEEPFLSGKSWITDLKIRAAWGQMGNQEIANYNQYYTYRSSIDQSAYDLSGSNTSVLPGFDTQRFGNPDGRWETTTTLDIGFDWTIWNKMTVNFDLYDMTTTDMLYVLTLPGTMGDAESPFQNVGEMSNKGVDLAITWNGASSKGDFRYTIGFNLSHYKNEIIKLSDNATEGFFGSSLDLNGESYTRNEAGVPYSSFYGYIIDGFTDGSESYWDEDDNGIPIYVSDEFPGYYNYGDGKGRFKYRDVNGDTVITDADRTFIGNPHPDFTFGLNFNATYKNLDFALFLQGSQGNDIINHIHGETDFWSPNSNRSKKSLYESWTPELGDEAKLPIQSTIDNISSRPSTYFVEDGSYIRLKNAQIGYTIPNLQGIDKFRIYFQATNLFTITSYTGLDPEINISGSGSKDANLGLDRSYYPASRQFLIGINFGL